jgi:hypothetical protein
MLHAAVQRRASDIHIRLGAGGRRCEFYLKRSFRILPAFLAVLALYPFVPILREGTQPQPTWRFLTFTMNFGLDYRVTGAFTHAWSLCVEEHFDLVLPALVLLLRKLHWRGWIVLIAGGLLGPEHWRRYAGPRLTLCLGWRVSWRRDLVADRTPVLQLRDRLLKRPRPWRVFITTELERSAAPVAADPKDCCHRASSAAPWKVSVKAPPACPSPSPSSARAALSASEIPADSSMTNL